MQTLPKYYNEPFDIFSSPIKVSTLLSDSLEVFRRAPFYLICLPALIQAPAVVVMIIVPRLMLFYGYSNFFTTNGLSVLDYFWSLLSSVITILVVTKVVDREYFTFHDIVDGFFKRIIPACLTQLWVSVITIFMMLLIIPGIIVSNNLVFTLQHTVARGLSGKTAMDKSEEMVEGLWMRVFGINLVPSLLGFFLNLFLTYSAGWVLGNKFFYLSAIGFFMEIFWTFTMVYTTIFFFKLERTLNLKKQPQTTTDAETTPTLTQDVQTDTHV